MPFEAYEIDMVDKHGEVTAHQLAELYQRVRERGGQVIGEHHVQQQPRGTLNEIPESVTFIVAEFPEGI